MAKTTEEILTIMGEQADLLRKVNASLMTIASGESIGIVDKQKASEAIRLNAEAIRFVLMGTPTR